MQEVKKRRAEIAQAEHPTWKTNCSFSYTENRQGPVNFHVCKDVHLLAMIAGWLHVNDMTFQGGCDAIGIPVTPYTHQGYPVSDWIDDIKTRVSQIQIEDKRKKLASLESRLQSIMTPELKAQLELEAIEKELA